MKLLLMILILVFSTSVNARNCWLNAAYNESKDKTAFAIEHSGLIFIGTTVSTVTKIFDEVGHEELVLEISTEFEVSENLKGESDKRILVSGNEIGSCGCRYKFKPGVEYMVLARKVGNKYTSHFCDWIRPYSKEVYSDFELKVESSTAINDDR